MPIATTDLCDAHSDDLRILTPIFSDYGGRAVFSGRVTTVRCFEDNSLVRETLETPGDGGVLVVDGGGSMRCALLGDKLGDLGVANGWSGIVVYGCVRDAAALRRLELGVRALNVHPLKSVKRGGGERDEPVTFAGVTLRPGDWLYADDDGVVVSADRLD